MNKPMPEKWSDILLQEVPLYSRLPKELKDKLHGLIHIFLDEKKFFGFEDFKITDEVCLTVAGNACMLLINKKQNFFPRFKSILIYPEAVVSKQAQYDGRVVTRKNSVRAGESWYRGPIVLSWADVKRDMKVLGDGHNVILHEFAHKLDEQDNAMDGLPILKDGNAYREWAEVLTKEFDLFLDRVEKNKNRVIDEYGATSAAEFFAVATESFFEKPALMKRKLPDLYKQLESFYKLDPAAWGVGDT